MEYSDLVKRTASDLVLKFSNHLSDVSMGDLKGVKGRDSKDYGTLAFDLSSLNGKEKSHVLSLAEETLKFSYTFKIKGKDAKVISYECNTWGIPLSLFNYTVTVSFIFVGFLVLICLYLLIKWFVL